MGSKREPLKINDEITLKKVGNNKSESTFKILPYEKGEDISCKSGANCLVYRVSISQIDGYEHQKILKEFYPCNFDGMRRDEKDKGLFYCDESHIDNYVNKLEEVIADYLRIFKVINENRDEHPKLDMFMPASHELYYSKSTIYLLTNGNNFGSKCYSDIDIKDESLERMFKIIKEIAEGLKELHNLGYLHLDIKDKNILVDELDKVEIFDYDTIIKEDREGGFKCSEILYDCLDESVLIDKGKWMDIFSIGALVYSRLFNENLSSDTYYNVVLQGKYDFRRVEALKNATPKALNKIKELLDSTLKVDDVEKTKYKSADEIINQIDIILNSLNERCELIEKPFPNVKNFVGREEDFVSFKKLLDDKRYVFLLNNSHAGKTYFITKFVEQNKSDFSIFQYYNYLDYENGIEDIIKQMPFYGIDNGDVNAKIEYLRKTDRNTIIVIDNFNNKNDKYLKKLTRAPRDSFRLVLVSSSLNDRDLENFANYSYNLGEMSENDCKALLKSICNREADDYDLECFKKLKYNAMAISIVFGSSVAKSKSSKWIYDNYINPFSEIEQICFSVLSDDERLTISNFLLISQYGISLSEFIKCSQSAIINENTIFSLLQKNILENINKNSSEEKILRLRSSIVSIARKTVGADYSDNNLVLAESLIKKYSYDENIECADDNLICNIIDRLETLRKNFVHRDNSNELEIANKININLARYYECIDKFEEAEEVLNEASNLCDRMQEICIDSKCNEKINCIKTYIYFHRASIKNKSIRDINTNVHNNVKIIEEACNFSNSARDCLNDKVDSKWRVRLATCFADICLKKSQITPKIIKLDEIKNCLNSAKDYLQDEMNAVPSEFKGIIKDRLYFIEKRLNEIENKSSANDNEIKSDVYSAIDSINADADISRIESAIMENKSLGMTSDSFKKIYLNEFWQKIFESENCDTFVQSVISVFRSINKASHDEFYKKLSLKGICKIENIVSDFYLQKYNFEYALKYAEDAYKISNGSIESSLILSKIYIYLNDSNSAAEIIDNIRIKSISSGIYLLNIKEIQVVAYIGLGRYKEAQDICNEMIKKYPNNSKVKIEMHIFLWQIYMLIGKKKEIINEEKILVKNLLKAKYSASDMSKNYKEDILYRRTYAKFRGGNSFWDKSAKVMTEALSVAKEANDKYQEAVILNERGYYYLNNQEYNKAFNDFKSCYKVLNDIKAPDNLFLPLYNNVLNFFYKNVQYDEAIKVFEDIKSMGYEEKLKGTSLLSSIYNNAACLIAKSSSDVNEALELLRKAKSICTDISVERFLIIYNILRLLLVLEKESEAQEEIREARNIFYKITSQLKIICGESQLDMIKKDIRA